MYFFNQTTKNQKSEKFSNRDYQSEDFKTLVEKSEVYKNLTSWEKEEVMTSLTALNVGEIDFGLFTK